MSAVELLVYDLSRGMAATMSLPLTGIQIDGIWHTSIVVHGIEWFFGQGIANARPRTTHHGQPTKSVALGSTTKSDSEVRQWIQSVRGSWTAARYHLLDYNCNNFTSVFSRWLTGNDIPSYISSLPATVLNTPFGQMMRPQIDAMFGAGASTTEDVAVESLMSSAVQRQGPTGKALRFEAALNAPAALSKLRSFSPSSSSIYTGLEKDVMPYLPPSTLPSSRVSLYHATLASSTNSLIAVLTPDQLFPIIDLLRVALLRSDTAGNLPPSILSKIISLKPIELGLLGSLVLLRLISNVLSPTPGPSTKSSALLISSSCLSDTTAHVLEGLQSEDKRARIAAGRASLGLVRQCNGKVGEAWEMEFISGAYEALGRESETWDVGESANELDFQA